MTQSKTPQQARTERKVRAASLSIFSNTLLTLLKLIVGFWSGSVSILSEAVHSASDLIASGIAFLSVRLSENPPDADHPYGHGKIESISSLAESLLIFLGAAYIVYEAIEKLRHPGLGHSLALDAGLGVMALSALLNALISRHLMKVARETESLALEADAEHLKSDVLTSLGVLIGLALARYTGNPRLDSLTALAVALLILHTAFRLTRNSLHPLLDARLPAEEEETILHILDSEPRVLGYHKLRTRKSGSERHADLHVQMDDFATLVAAHDLTEELEDSIRDALPGINVHIHMEPYQAEMQHQEEVHGIPRSTQGKQTRP